LIDLHCHPLAAGDGPADQAESIELLRALGAEGVEVAAVTPYVAGGAPADAIARIKDDVAALREAARGGGVPALIPGAELELGWALAASEEQLRGATYGQLGKTLLVRAPDRGTTADFDDMLLNLSLRGFRVVLAHPERNRSYQDQPVRLGRLVREGVVVQIDAASILAGDGSRARRMAVALLHEGAAHVIASNAHTMRTGPPRFAEAVQVAEQIAGPRARWMVNDAPAAILAGAELPAPPATAARRRGIRRTGTG
jgi:protein-tyrosine phosphatase